MELKQDSSAWFQPIVPKTKNLDTLGDDWGKLTLKWKLNNNECHSLWNTFVWLELGRRRRV